MSRSRLGSCAPVLASSGMPQCPQPCGPCATGSQRRLQACIERLEGSGRPRDEDAAPSTTSTCDVRGNTGSAAGVLLTPRERRTVSARLGRLARSPLPPGRRERAAEGPGCPSEPHGSPAPLGRSGADSRTARRPRQHSHPVSCGARRATGWPARHVEPQGSAPSAVRCREPRSPLPGPAARPRDTVGQTPNDRPGAHR